MANRNLILETERLRLRRFNPGDAEFVLRLLNSPGWLRYIGDRGVRDLEGARQYITEAILVAYEQYGYGLWMIVLKSNREPIGGCGLIRRNGLEYADIGFALLPDYSEKGYAQEIAAATLTYARNELGLPKVLGITLPENQRSISLLEKIGLKFEKMIRLSPEAEELMLFGIDLRNFPDLSATE